MLPLKFPCHLLGSVLSRREGARKESSDDHDDDRAGPRHRQYRQNPVNNRTATVVSIAVAKMMPSALRACSFRVGLVPQHRSAQIVEAHITWDYTTWVNIVFLGLAALLVWRFLRTGGPEMLRMMNKPVLAQAHQHP